jgi:hypothetical protein
MIYWGLMMYRKLQIDKSQCSPAVLNAMKTLFIYPIIIVVCWLPQALLNTFSPDLPADSKEVVGVNSLAILQGGVSAIAFFYNSKETRSNWMNLFITVFPHCAKFLAPSAKNVAEDNPSRKTIVYSVDEDFEGDDFTYGQKSESGVTSDSRPQSVVVSPLSDLTVSTYGGRAPFDSQDDQL